MRRKIDNVWLTILFCMFPFAETFGEEINFMSNRMSAGKAALAEDAFYQSQVLGTANFSPELCYPVQLFYRSNATDTGYFGYAWTCPQLESKAIPQKDGFEWKTPWGETIKFFSKKKPTKDTLEFYREEMKGSREFFAFSSDWEADGKNGDWMIFGKRDKQGWMFTYKNSLLTRITSPANRVLIFNYVNNGQIKSITQDNKAFVEFSHDKGVISEITINGFQYKLTYSNQDIPVLPETLNSEPLSLKKIMLTGYSLGSLSPVRFSYAKGLLTEIQQGNRIEHLIVQTEEFDERMAYLRTVAEYRETQKDTSKIERSRVHGRIEWDGKYIYRYPSNKPGSVRLTNTMNETSEYDYDNERGIYRVKGFDGKETKTYFFKRYDVAYNGNIRQIIDGKERVLVNYRYDKSTGKVTQIRDMSLNEIYFTYDSNGKLNLIEKRDADSSEKTPILRFAYDNKNNPTSLMPLNADGSILYTVRQSFNNQNQLATRTDGQSSIRYAYNDFGYVKEITDQFNLSKTFHYDQYNRISSVINPNGVEVLYTYNDYGKVSKLDSFFSLSRQKKLKSLVIEYDECGLPVAYTDHKGHVTRFERDNFGRVISEFFADDTSNRYEYDSLGRMVKVIDPNQNEITFSWDKHGLAKRMNEEKQMLFYQYGKDGLLDATVATFQTEATAKTTKYAYDDYDRVQSITYDQDETLSVEYDTWGRVIEKTMSDGMQTRTYSINYDYHGRVARTSEVLIEKGGKQELLENHYTYNPWGQRLSRQTSRITPAMDEQLFASWKYDQYGRLIESKDGNNTVSYLYNNKNQIARRTANGCDTHYFYTGLGFLERKQFGGGADGRNADILLRYLYDTDGALIGREVNGESFNYKYDVKGQLIAVFSASGEKVEAYQYDAAGNILSKAIDGEITTFTYDKANQLISRKDADGKVTPFIYDGAGRLIKEGDIRYSYGWLDKVMSISEEEKITKTYNYYVNGQLANAVDVSSGDQEAFLWDGLTLIKRGNSRYINDITAPGGGTPVIVDGKVIFDDMLGNSIGFKDGDRLTEMRRDAFGNILTGSDDIKPELYEYDFFTGRPNVYGLGYNFVFRNYRSELGKWQTHDPKGYPDGWNNLAYCNNWVTISIDPWGLASLRIVCDVFEQNVWKDKGPGHVSIEYIDDNGRIVNYSTAGTFVGKPYDGLYIKEGTDVWQQTYTRTYDNLTDEQKEKFLNKIEAKGEQTFGNGFLDGYNWLFDNCGDFAIDVWKEVTGEDLDPPGLLTDPQAVSRMIQKANGGAKQGTVNNIAE